MRLRRGRRLSIRMLIPLLILAGFYLYYKSPLRQVKFPPTVPPQVSSHDQPHCNVLRIVDGDTFVCRFPDGKEEKIRLIGVNTPETSHQKKGVEYYGKEAKEFTKNTLSGKRVKLELDMQPRDRYGRLLAYVYLEDGTMLNALLVQEGYAQVMTVPPNVKYHDMFLKLQREAREQGKGLWVR